MFSRSNTNQNGRSSNRQLHLVAQGAEKEVWGRCRLRYAADVRWLRRLWRLRRPPVHGPDSDHHPEAGCDQRPHESGEVADRHVEAPVP